MEYNRIIQGDTKEVLKTIPAGSVNCIVTSPPYWGLRDYNTKPQIWDGDKDCKHDFDNIQRYNPTRGKRDGKGIYKDPKWEAKGSLKKEVKSNFCIKCGAWKGNLGLEPTFELYIKHLCDIFDEAKRVLRKDGTCWVNMGDTYWGGGQGGNDYGGKFVIPSTTFGHIAKGNGYPTKSLCLIPQRFAIEMVNRGWILRNTIIWHKPNCMPSSAKDRFTVDFEYVYFFVKNKKTLFWTNEKTLECVDKKPLGIRKGIEGKDWEWRRIGENYENSNTKINIDDAEKYNSPKARKYREKKLKKVSFWRGYSYWFEQQIEKTSAKFIEPRMMRGEGRRTYNGKYPEAGVVRSMSKNKRAVWTIPTKPFPEAHFAVYPEKLIEPMIKAGCPRYICKKCGKARVKIIDNTERINTRPGNNTGNMKSGKDIDPNKELHKSDLSKYRQQIKYKELGYTDCGCKNPEYEGGICLDPFMGAGTTGVVAKKQGKQYLGIELKQEYIDMANKRIRIIPESLF